MFFLELFFAFAKVLSASTATYLILNVVLSKINSGVSTREKLAAIAAITVLFASIIIFI